MSGEQCKSVKITLFLLLVTSVSWVSANILLVENDTIVNDASFSVAITTDFQVDFLCVGSAATTTWFRSEPNFIEMPSEFDQTITSYSKSTGLLRLYTDYILDNIQDADQIVFLCINNGPATVALSPVPTLFFSEDFPLTTNSLNTLSSICVSTLPDLPLSTVANVITNTVGDIEYGYCVIESARGVFRSPSVVIGEGDTGVVLPELTFIAEPLNVTVKSINGVTRGAFSCIVYPSNSVESITWYYQSGVLEAVPVNISDPDIMIESLGGTSVLVLDNVSMEDEGAYYCIVNSNDLISGRGYLIYSGMTDDNDAIILAPPTSLMEQEGNTLLIPCVGSTEPVFSGALPMATGGVFGLTIITDRQNNGNIKCQVGETTANVALTVFAPIRFEQELEKEVVRFINTESSPIILECEISGNPLPSLSFLHNNNPITTNTQLVTIETQEPNCSVCVRRVLSLMQPTITDFGIYQCVGEIDHTTIVSSSYINLQFLGNPIIFHDNQPVTDELSVLVNRMDPQMSIELTCSVDSHPIAIISWSRNDDITISGQQSISGFREPAISTVSVSLDGVLGRSVSVTCTAQLMEVEEATAIIITPYINVVIVEQPQDTPPVMMGDSASFTCTASSIPNPSIIWIRTRNGNEVILGSTTSELVNETSLRSTLQITFNGLISSYFCRASNPFSTIDSEIAAVIPIAAPSIIRDPDDIIAVDGEEVEFSCRASGSPSPNVTWVPLISPTINTLLNNGDVESVLMFMASDAMNRTTVHCVATNDEGTDSSNTAILIIAGPPAAPLIEVTAMQRSVIIEWFTPFSLIAITQYTVEITTDGVIVNTQLLEPSDPPLINNVTIQSLDPFTLYVATVTVVNRAGSNNASSQFTTLQAAPDGPPTNVVATAIDTSSVLISWEPPLINDINGEITNYFVRYYPINDPSDEQTLQTMEIERLVTVAIIPDTPYTFLVAAFTIAIGPYSLPIVQRSYPLPPPPPEESPRILDTNVTTTTIPIFLPNLNVSQFSHVWIVAVKLSDPLPEFLQQSPNDVFTDSNSLTIYSPNLADNTAYIVSEMSSAVYETILSQVFILGDEIGTVGSNDFPQLYRNGPLQDDTQYTVFIRAFIPAISPSTDGISKRQTDDSRQYEVYTSSDFSSATATQRLPPGGGEDGLTTAEIIGIVIAIIFLLILLPLIVVIVIVICNMWYRRVKHIGPPPVRQGSKRFKDNKEVVTVVSNPNTRPDSALQEITPDDVRLPTSVKDFPEHVRKLHANSDHPFSEEYQLITIKSPGLPHLQGSAACNVIKNRYANINSYDESRVHLSLIPGVEGSDFINANYIEGYQKKTLFVAAQGPLPNTVHDFWRMIWEEDSCCIVMLTNLNEKGRVKCHQYWPETGSLGLGDITVNVIETQDLAYYSIRTFRVTRGSEKREVKQFHYTGWPDFGVPDHPHPVLSFISRLNNFKRTTQGPDIIHCSAGVGRTGTLITIQSMMQMMEEEGKVDIFNFILGMRRQRSYLVQTERQYIFIHDALLEIIRVGNTEVPIQNLRRTYKELQAQDPHSETSRLEEEYLKLNGLPEIDPSLFTYATNTHNISKNRYPNIVPLDMYRVRLIMAPGIQCSDYINASYVDGYQRRHQYILTQGPMKSTVDDFWRMTWEHSVSCVLMLCQNEEKGEEMCAEYWSKDKLKQHGDLFVELSQEVTFTNYTMREFSVTNTKINDSRILKHYQYTEWTEEAVPSNSAAIIDLIGVLQKAQHQNGGGSIVLHDSTPIGRAGTFCILSSVLEQLKVEGVVDLFFFIHSLRQQQPGLVATFDQYKFCYTSVLEFLDSFDHYSNFD